MTETTPTPSLAEAARDAARRLDAEADNYCDIDVSLRHHYHPHGKDLHAQADALRAAIAAHERERAAVRELVDLAEHVRDFHSAPHTGAHGCICYECRAVRALAAYEAALSPTPADGGGR